MSFSLECLNIRNFDVQIYLYPICAQCNVPQGNILQTSQILSDVTIKIHFVPSEHFSMPPSLKKLREHSLSACPFVIITIFFTPPISLEICIVGS